MVVNCKPQELDETEPEVGKLKIVLEKGSDRRKKVKSKRSSTAQRNPMAAAQFVALNNFSLQQLSQQTSSHNGSSQNGNGNGNGSQSSRPVIERGASWSYNETRILLSLWGQDMVQRQLTNSKRTRHVWEKIADRIREHGFERTAGEFIPFLLPVSLVAVRSTVNPTNDNSKKIEWVIYNKHVCIKKVDHLDE